MWNKSIFSVLEHHQLSLSLDILTESRETAEVFHRPQPHHKDIDRHDSIVESGDEHTRYTDIYEVCDGRSEEEYVANPVKDIPIVVGKDNSI